MARNYYKSGGWNCICDRCGQKKKASEVRQEWTGFIICTECFETRHPQDFIRARQDKITVPFQRPIPTYVFVSVPYIIYWDTGYTVSGYVQGDNI